MLFSPHEPRNVPERFVALIPKVCTRALWRRLYATRNRLRERSVCARSPTFILPRHRSEWQKFGSRQKLKDEIQRRSERDFLNYLLKHNKEEPIIIGPGGIFYITDHHHLARALYDVGASNTYCTIVENLSNANPDDFWKHLEDKNEVYLKDQNGNPITPHGLPTSVKDLSNNPFRSLAGAVREACGFEKGDKISSGEDYLEFQWAIFGMTDRSFQRAWLGGTNGWRQGQFPPLSVHATGRKPAH